MRSFGKIWQLIKLLIIFNNKDLLFVLCDLSLCYSPSEKVLLQCFEIYVNEGCPKDYKYLS